MKKLKLFLLSLILLFLTACSLNVNTQPDDPINPPIDEEKPGLNDGSSNEDENFGLDVIEIDLSLVTITEDGLYTSLECVSVYIYTYHKLPNNYKKKGVFNKKNYSLETLESCGGDVFYNRELLLPLATGRVYTECDIDYTGGNRNAKRIVYSSDFLIFYTDDHYESFKIVRFVNETSS